MTILVIGATGLLGQDVMRCPTKHRVIGAGSRGADIRDAQATRALVRLHAPDWVLLLAAITNVDKCEREPELAWSVNRDGAVNVAQAVHEAGGRLIYVSTDYVFDGTRDFPYEYEVSDVKHPLSVYGATKSEAEDRVRELLPEACVARTSWVFGRGRENFPLKVLAQAARHEEVTAVADKFSVPSYGRDVARILFELVEVNASGMFHAVNTGGTSWHEVAVETLRLAGIADVPVKPISIADMKWAAPRPRNSVLATTSLSNIGIVTRPWREALAEFVAEIKQRPGHK
jgi:dTDP-4-dehydrorhamnose reductase